MSGIVRALYVCPEAGALMKSCEYVLALPDKGLDDDRYGKGIGSFSQSKRKTVRQVSFVAIEDIEKANLQCEHPFLPSETRRNILTSGIDLRELIGRTFTVGTARFLGIEECTPCARPSELLDKPGFKDAFRDRGGLRAQVIVGGIVQVGDSFSVSKRIRNEMHRSRL